MNETNKLINDKKNPTKETYMNEFLNEEIILFDIYPIKKLTFYRIKLGFFFCNISSSYISSNRLL